MLLRNILLSTSLVASALFASPVYATAITVNGACGTGTNKSSTTLTLTQSASAGDLVVVGVHSERTSGAGLPYASVSGITSTHTAGLWHQRGTTAGGQFLSTGGSIVAYNDTEEWWAYPSGAMSSETITITFAQTTDNATAGACSYTNVNPSNPFDSNGALPGFAHAITGITTGTYSTSNANDTLLGYAFNPTGANQTSPGIFNGVTGTALDYNVIVTSGTNASGSSSQHLNVTTARTSETFQANNASAVWLTITDAMCSTTSPSACTGGTAASACQSLALLGTGC